MVAVVMSPKARCPSRWASFGLNYDFLKNVTYEEIFFLQHHGKFSVTEAYSLPIGLRKWYVERTVQHFEDKSKQS